MFLQKILSREVQDFIRKNTGNAASTLALKKNPFPDIAWQDIVNQIAARDKAKDKLPTWFAAENIIYPSKISVEQTSSETAAEYKSGLVAGETLIDLTGGFGIDDFYFSKKMTKVTHCELNPELSAIAKHNFEVLDADNTECIPGDSTEILSVLNRQFDWIYIDPSRRSDSKGKVFLLKDCLPNVPELLNLYFRHTANILIKTAPLLDIHAGMQELHSVKEVHILALNNEVKELLWLLEKDFKGTPQFLAVNISKETTDTFIVPEDNDAEPVYVLPQKYMYEPNSAVMKTGAFNSVATHFDLGKLHNNTHLYTSDKLIAFPGRRFKTEKVIPFSKTEMKGLERLKMNITTRNFPLTVEEIRKKWKLKDGGETYAFFTTNKLNEKIVILCSKV